MLFKFDNWKDCDAFYNALWSLGYMYYLDSVNMTVRAYIPQSGKERTMINLIAWYCRGKAAEN